ncbi:hypothetical protein HG536_0D05350 [Torulaspora globosa]|uniref:Pre-mRNA-splicing factor SYF2 n=1 Tax=Torulaspora globosa TaxID=48254 RepID=A0A7G3ZHM7_9SACH|nr:uncharacterized protein HG536_0D05350 [Torulaspora globosa]QLL33013.1 hypothetical protein HG536_0D05350 [Torulaspora globosa]
MSLEDYEQRFKELKRRSFEVSIKIGKIAEREAKEQAKIKRPRVYKMEADESEDRSSQDSAERRREKLMGYTIREYENWEKKLQEKEAKKEGANLQELAKYAYDKQLSKFRKYAGTPKSAKIQKDQKTGKIKISDDRQLVNRLASDLERTSKERYLARKKEMERRNVQATPGGYINDKNKQFNEKLDRQVKDVER